MSTTTHKIAAVTAAVAVMITGAQAAQAQPTRAKAVKPFADNLIVVQKSLGGFAIGEAPADVKKHFPKKHCARFDCQYTGSGYTAVTQFGSKPGSTKTNLDFVSLTATKGKDGAAKVRTSTGVGLGSSLAKAKKGLKHARYYGNKQSGYFFIGKGKLGTVGTTIYVTNNAVNQIVVQRIDHVG